MRAGRDDTAPTAVASLRVDAAKVALGERGSVWWDDGGTGLQSANGGAHALRPVVRGPGLKVMPGGHRREPRNLDLVARP